MSKPLISVVTAVYNGAKYIEDTVASILNQTVGDFEYILVDDGSSDDSVARIEKFGDPRLRVIRNSKNLRLVGARNVGLAACTGDFVALIDHDDLAAPKRFEFQLAALQRDPSLRLVGSRAQKFISGGGDVLHRQPRTEDKACCAARLVFRNEFVNSTVFFKRAGLRQHLYRPEFPLSEDYDFIARVAALGGVRILPEVLLRYRLHAENYSKAAAPEMLRLGREVKKWQLMEMGISPTDADMSLHSLFEHPQAGMTASELKQAALWARKLIVANSKSKRYDPIGFLAVVHDELAVLAEHAARMPFFLELLSDQEYRQALLSNPKVAARALGKMILRRLAPTG